ncbi:MAG: hypothetical protein LBT80_00730, partial [Lactobacillaceae bacterium]|nr:hypothetical protein [Lactobacillaceae bacterium]
PAPDIQTHNGHGAGPLADLSPYLRHPFPTNLSLPESPSRPKFYNNFDATSGKQQSPENKTKTSANKSSPTTKLARIYLLPKSLAFCIF